MSTVAEIEAAIDRLSAEEKRRLQDWLLARPVPAEASHPKTGAELAALWSHRPHLTPDEADAFAADLDTLRARQASPRPLAWE